MAVLAVRGRQYRRRRQTAGAAATMALGGAVLATGWCVEVLRGARQAGELEQRAVGEGEAREETLPLHVRTGHGGLCRGAGARLASGQALGWDAGKLGAQRQALAPA